MNYSLIDGATKLGMSKKALDDYLLEVRRGVVNGFDFKANKNDKLGKLR